MTIMRRFQKPTKPGTYDYQDGAGSPPHRGTSRSYPRGLAYGDAARLPMQAKGMRQPLAVCHLWARGQGRDLRDG